MPYIQQYIESECVAVRRDAMCRQFSIVCVVTRKTRNEERIEKAAVAWRRRYEARGLREVWQRWGRGGKGVLGGMLRCANAIKSGMCAVAAATCDVCLFVFVVLGAAHDIAFNSN